MYFVYFHKSSTTINLSQNACPKIFC
uniref:Uncharacterized protein n=1 Tax=Rhizophora mucronata TaxID=61149 RepID=A0A2P2NFI1_RHIMU